MPLKSTAVTVTTTATLLCDGTTGTVTMPVSVVVEVAGSGQTVYVGGADVTSANGLPVATGTFSPAIDLVGEQLYGIVAATTQAVNVLRTRG